MGTITISVDDKIESEFRKAVVDFEGGKKGDLGKAVTEAMETWMKGKRQKEIAERQIMLSEKGLYRLPKNWKFNREEVYDGG